MIETYWSLKLTFIFQILSQKLEWNGLTQQTKEKVSPIINKLLLPTTTSNNNNNEG